VQSATECVPEVLRDGGPLVAERCPFDGVVAPSIEGNLEHMASCHGFFVPYIADLAKATELLEYLVRKVYLGYACIFCGGALPRNICAITRSRQPKAAMRRAMMRAQVPRARVMRATMGCN